MQYWQATNLTPKRLKALIGWFKWIVHYEIWTVTYDEPNIKESRIIFQAEEEFVRKHLLPEKIEVESGEDVITFLTSPIPTDLIDEEDGKEFIITDLNQERAKIAVSKIAWHLFCAGEESIFIQQEDYENLASGISITLYNKNDIALLEELLAEDFLIYYRDFAWAPYT